MEELVEKYIEILDQELKEKEYQDFIEANTQFVPRHFVQNHGVHMSLVLRKLKISNDMVTDFVILSKSSIGWNYILVEIEKPSSRFFKSGSTDVHSDFIRGVKQIKSWKAWFSKPDNKSHFESQLRFIKKPISNTPVEIKYVLVTGRRSEYKDSEDKIHTIRSYESFDFKIMSFDSLVENVHNNEELYLGLRRQGSIEIKSQKVLDTAFLQWCDDSDFQLNPEIKRLFIEYLENKKASYEAGPSLKGLGARQIDKMINRVSKMKVVNA
ncbi:MAG: hypothetical protein ACI9L9_001448 [Marivirga sp.]|jgi:hypothetical protein